MCAAQGEAADTQCSRAAGWAASHESTDSALTLPHSRTFLGPRDSVPFARRELAACANSSPDAAEPSAPLRVRTHCLPRTTCTIPEDPRSVLLSDSDLRHLVRTSRSPSRHAAAATASPRHPAAPGRCGAPTALGESASPERTAGAGRSRDVRHSSRRYECARCSVSTSPARGSVSPAPRSPLVADGVAKSTCAVLTNGAEAGTGEARGVSSSDAPQHDMDPTQSGGAHSTSACSAGAGEWPQACAAEQQLAAATAPAQRVQSVERSAVNEQAAAPVTAAGHAQANEEEHSGAPAAPVEEQPALEEQALIDAPPPPGWGMDEEDTVCTGFGRESPMHAVLHAAQPDRAGGAQGAQASAQVGGDAVRDSHGSDGGGGCRSASSGVACAEGAENASGGGAVDAGGKGRHSDGRAL